RHETDGVGGRDRPEEGADPRVPLSDEGRPLSADLPGRRRGGRLRAEMHSSVLRRHPGAGQGPFPLPLSQWLLRRRRGAAHRRTGPTAVDADKAGAARRQGVCGRRGGPDGMIKPKLTRAQKETTFTAISWLVMLLVILQLWLLTAT